MSNSIPPGGGRGAQDIGGKPAGGTEDPAGLAAPKAEPVEETAPDHVVSAPDTPSTTESVTVRATLRRPRETPRSASPTDPVPRRPDSGVYGFGDFDRLDSESDTDAPSSADTVSVSSMDSRGKGPRDSGPYGFPDLDSESATDPPPRDDAVSLSSVGSTASVAAVEAEGQAPEPALVEAALRELLTPAKSSDKGSAYAALASRKRSRQKTLSDATGAESARYTRSKESPETSPDHETFNVDGCPVRTVNTRTGKVVGFHLSPGLQTFMVALANSSFRPLPKDLAALCMLDAAARGTADPGDVSPGRNEHGAKTRPEPETVKERIKAKGQLRELGDLADHAEALGARLPEMRKAWAAGQPYIAGRPVLGQPSPESMLGTLATALTNAGVFAFAEARAPAHAAHGASLRRFAENTGPITGIPEALVLAQFGAIVEAAITNFLPAKTGFDDQHTFLQLMQGPFKLMPLMLDIGEPDAVTAYAPHADRFNKAGKE